MKKNDNTLFKLNCLIAFTLISTISACNSKPKVADDGKIEYPMLSRKKTQKVVADHLVGIRDCYETALLKYPETSKDLTGKILVEWNISDLGLVKDPKIISSELNNQRFENCLLQEIQTWIFEKLPQGTTAKIRYPFVFSNK